MPEKVDKRYVQRAIDQLFAVLGVRDHAPFAEGVTLRDQADVETCVQRVASHMGLPVRIQLTFVRDAADPSVSGFQSCSLARTAASGSAEGITAQVTTPEFLPFYGSGELVGLPIQVKVSENCVAYPKTFIAIIAHELSHVLLRSLAHPERDNEIYTDVTAMLMGFSHVMEDGRQIVRRKDCGDWVRTERTTFGYLADREFDYAVREVDALLKKYSSDKKEILSLARALSEECEEAKQTLTEFHDLLDYLDGHTQRRTKKRDASALIACHMPGRTEPLEEVLKSALKIARTAENAAKRISWYNESTAGSLTKYREPLVAAKTALCGPLNQVRADCHVLKRNIGFFARRRLAKKSGKKRGS